ncbi:MAG: glycosyltransferase family 4 protein [Planctomycetales bacterium]|nr:glycosyltransferase family 4 protein [Planctomycetales bacterium]
MNWITCQIGAREHYAVPRALAASEAAITLVTDYWAGHFRWLLPRRLRERVHDDIERDCVRSFNTRFLRGELSSTLAGKRGWDAILARNEWFQKYASDVVRALVRQSPEPPVVFAYSYAAEAILEVARDAGCPTVLGQIDPGPAEWRIVDQLAQREGVNSSDRPPRTYWDNWRRECDVCDIILVNSDWSREGLREEGVNADKIRVVPLAYDSLVASRPAAPGVAEHFTSQNRLKVLFLGQIILRKGLVELAEAATRLKDEPIDWIIVGGGDSWLLDHLSGCPNCRVVGPVPRANAASFYRSADLFILPTHSDGYALTQLEAAAFGLPIVASRHCGSVVKDGVNGLLLSEVSADAICNAMFTVLGSPGLLAQMAVEQRAMPLRGINALGNDLLRIGQELGVAEAC